MLINPTPKKLERISLETGDFVIPFFDENELPPDYCSRFVRLCLLQRGIKISPRDAWKMRENLELNIHKINSSQFEYLTGKKKLIPGTIVGVYDKKSKMNDEANRFYTHLSLYIGDKKEKPFLLEQFKEEIRIVSLDFYNKVGLEVREILIERPCSA